MDKKLNITSKQKYISPSIDVAHLRKQDVLEGSDENVKTNGAELGAKNDLISSVLEDLGIQ